MKKYIILLFLYLLLLYLSLIRLEYRQDNSIKNSNQKIDICEYLDVLIQDSTLYIPSFGDPVYYEDPEPEFIHIEKFEQKNKKLWIAKALYKISSASEDEIQNMLFSAYPNIRVYGYMFYIRNTNDVYFEYLLESLQSTETVEYVRENLWVHGKCYVSDLLLLIALKGVSYPRLLPQHSNLLKYELTAEQKDILKTTYNRKTPVNKYIDFLIRYYFEYEEKDN